MSYNVDHNQKSYLYFNEKGVFDSSTIRKKGAEMLTQFAVEKLGFFGSIGIVAAIVAFTFFKLLKMVMSPAQIETYDRPVVKSHDK